MNEQHYDLIEEVLNQIDWAKAHAMYDAVGWMWDRGDDAHVPEAGDLRENAYKACKSIIKEGQFLTSSGGITVYWYKETEWLSVHVGLQGDGNVEEAKS